MQEERVSPGCGRDKEAWWVGLEDEGDRKAQANVGLLMASMCIGGSLKGISTETTWTVSTTSQHCLYLRLFFIQRLWHSQQPEQTSKSEFLASSGLRANIFSEKWTLGGSRNSSLVTVLPLLELSLPSWGRECLMIVPHVSTIQRELVCLCSVTAA